MAALNVRSAARTALERVAATIRAEDFNPDRVEINHLLKQLEKYFERFSENHLQLVAAADADELAAHEELYAMVEETYDKTSIRLRRLENALDEEGVHRDLRSVHSHAGDVRLDPVSIPVFDGRPENWLVFKDMFETLVHNRPDFEATYKLSKLRQYVRADSVPMVSSVYTGGYEQVWAELKRRYDNPRRLVETHVSRVLDMPDNPVESAKTLQNIVDCIRNTLRALLVMELPVEHWDAIMFPILLRKLPHETRSQYNMSVVGDELPKLEDILVFVERRALNLPAGDTRQELGRQRGTGGKSVKAHIATANALRQVATSKVSGTARAQDQAACPHCSGQHRLHRCHFFRNCSVAERWEKVKKMGNTCFNCLGNGHRSLECTSGVCQTCGQKHHTLLCRKVVDTVLLSGTTEPRNADAPEGNRVVLLATARAFMLDRHGNERPVRIICDPGSQVSFLTEQLANDLQLRRRSCEMAVEGIGAGTSTYTRGQTTVQLRSMVDTTFELFQEVYILRSITSNSPSESIDPACCDHLRNLALADPTYGSPGRIDGLIGADVWCAILMDGIVTSGNEHEPCAVRTRLGWVVLGPATMDTTVATPRAFIVNKCAGDLRLENLLHRFWQLEESASQPNATSDPCEEIFERTFTRNQDGRYVVQIPFHPEAQPLGNSHRSALRQFNYLERKLSGNVEIRQKYIDFMREYIELGHMSMVQESQIDSSHYFIPHHCVTTKFRVVFNASAPTTNGISLNDTQLAGPQLQDNLVDIIFRFRRGEVAITGDVEKMFRQVQVDIRHRNWQKILWRETPSDTLHTYQLATVTYGMKSSPFNAIRALRQCAVDNQHLVTVVSRANAARDSILSNFYVDDYLASVDSPSEAIALASDVDTILRAGHFHLRKWNSNNAQTLAAITRATQINQELDLSDHEQTVLGLHWDPLTDELFYKIQVAKSETDFSKRVVLGEIARLYDPTGMLAPVIVTAKIFIQSLVRERLDWDTPLPEVMQSVWTTYRNALQQLSTIRVPRWFGMKIADKVMLHGFCDASIKAYAAVVYVCSVNSSMHKRTSLVTAKTKVAPLKAITIPRLELCAAHLLVVTINNVIKALELKDYTLTLWSDSTIVLSWLRKSAASLKPYVSNRVAYIQQNSDINCWRHISTSQNPADCASRGLSPSALEGHSLWWKGPACMLELTNSSSDMPRVTTTEQEVIRSEYRATHVALIGSKSTHLTTTVKGMGAVPLVERFSTLSRLLHTTAYILRFRPTSRIHCSSAIVTTEEEDAAMLIFIRESQGNSFKHEINALQSQSSVDAKSKLLPLNPFLDDSGILRVGGRLANADLPYDQRHPVLLPKDCALARLLVGRAHQTTLHGGIQEMLQLLRHRYWILHSRALVKSYIHQCVPCKRHQRKMQQQQMSTLPRSRVLVAPPFTNTGLDYCGPFHVRLGSRRATSTVKTYAAIFVCMNTKAVHIELAEDLSTRAFLDVFDRFISRRGYCRTLFSDNGTQFVGAARLMQAELTEWNNSYAIQHLADLGVDWKFIVPAAPHHGGLWEAAVRSTKKHLLRVVGNQHLRFQQLNTLLIRIEACLNSRPIIALHDTPDEALALTPGDFLVGRPLLSRPEPSLPEAPVNRMKYWQQIQRMLQHFWQRWQQEYLTILQARSKWVRPMPNMQIGDVVVIQHDHLPPSRWRIGRIVDVHPGSDGLIRIVTIEYNSDQKTASGSFVKHQCQRPVQKVCRLIEAHEEVLNRTDSAGQNV